MPLSKLNDTAAIVAAHLDAEVASGFPRLRNIPSSQVIRFLDYFTELEVGERRALLDSCARMGALQFFPPKVSYDAILAMQSDSAFRRYAEATRQGSYAMGLCYSDLRMTRMMGNDAQTMTMMAQTRSKLDYIPRDDFPSNLVSTQDPRALLPAKAPQLRKLLDAAFKHHFAATKEKKIGGVLLYTGTYETTPIRIEIIFSNRGPQLQYAVRTARDVEVARMLGFSYETLWAAGTGWDYITEDYAERAVALLCDLITDSIRLRNTIAERLLE